MKFIQTDQAPSPAGHYSQAVTFDNLIFVSGQLPINPATNEKINGSIQEQAHQVFKNVGSVLKASGSDFNHVLKSTVYITDISLWDEVNTIYADYFGEHRPARAIVPVRDLHFGFKIEKKYSGLVKKLD